MQESFVGTRCAEGMLRPIIAQNGASVAQVGKSLVDQEWIQGRKQAVEDVARVYGIPPYVLFTKPGRRTRPNRHACTRTVWRRIRQPGAQS